MQFLPAAFQCHHLRWCQQRRHAVPSSNPCCCASRMASADPVLKMSQCLLALKQEQQLALYFKSFFGLNKILFRNLVSLLPDMKKNMHHFYLMELKWEHNLLCYCILKASSFSVHFHLYYSFQGSLLVRVSD